MSRRGVVVVALVIAVLAFALAGERRARTPGAGARAVPVVRDTTREEKREVVLFFASPGGDSLSGESREQVSRPGLHERVEGLVRELVRGSRAGGVALLPPGTAVRHVYLDHRGLMTLDLTPAFHDRFEGGSTAEYLAVRSLVRTLFANVPEAQRVRLVCGGERLVTLADHIACDRPFDRADLP